MFNNNNICSIICSMLKLVTRILFKNFCFDAIIIIVFRIRLIFQRIRLRFRFSMFLSFMLFYSIYIYIYLYIFIHIFIYFVIVCCSIFTLVTRMLLLHACLLSDQIKSNHTVGVVQQLPFDTRETISQNPNTLCCLNLMFYS